MRSNSPSVNPDRVNEDEPHLELSSNSYSPTYNRVLMVTSPILYFLHVFMSPLYSFFFKHSKIDQAQAEETTSREQIANLSQGNLNFDVYDIDITLVPKDSTIGKTPTTHLQAKVTPLTKESDTIPNPLSTQEVKRSTNGER